MALVYRPQGKLKEAHEEIEKALTLQPENPSPALGWVYAAMGKRREAQRVLALKGCFDLEQTRGKR